MLLRVAVVARSSALGDGALCRFADVSRSALTPEIYVADRRWLVVWFARWILTATCVCMEGLLVGSHGVLGTYHVG